MSRLTASFSMALVLGATIIVPGADAQGPTKNTARYRFITIDVPFPGVGETAAIGINDRGQIVGFYNDGTGHHGFVDDRGRFSPIDVPFPGATGTELHRINDRGQIIGLFTTSGGQERGFLDDQRLFSPIVAPFPGTEQTLTFGINNEGQIVGGYVNSSGSHGFVDDEGRFRSIDVPFPGAFETSAFGINDRDQSDRGNDRGIRGQIVGQYQDNVGTHGFIDNKGRFSPIDVPFPGVSATFARDINNRGQIVGIYDDRTGRHGFVDDRGRFSPIDVPFPGVSETDALGINNRGWIVGLYFDSSGGHGFLADPVERFAGTPGKADCPGQSVSALAGQFGGLNAAAAALEFSGVPALQDAILVFCQE